MIFNTEKDLSKLRGTQGGLSQATLIKLAHDLDSFINELHLRTEAPEDSEFVLVRRAHYAVGILSTLHSLSTGTEWLLLTSDNKLDSFDELSSILPDEAALLSRACAVLAILDTSISSPATWRANPSFAAKNKLLIEQHLSFIFASAPQKPELDALCKQIQFLVVILLARITSIKHPLEILTPTLELADTLLSNTTATEMAPKYNPLDIHLFSLVVMTLLEFAESVDDQLVAPAHDGIAKVRRALEQIAERASADADTLEGMHWASCLLRIIAAHDGSGSKSNSNGTITSTGEKDPNIDPAMAVAGKETSPSPALLQGQSMSAFAAARVSGIDGQGDKMMDVKSGVVQVVDMSVLLRRGYLNVVGELCGV